MILVSPGSCTRESRLVFLAHLFRLGYVIENPELFSDGLLNRYSQLMADLEKLRGGSDTFVPLYANFPDQVPKPGDYLLNRVLGYVLYLSSWEVDGVKLESGITVPKWLFELEEFGADPISQQQDWNLFFREKIRQIARGSEKPEKPTSLRFLPEEKALEEAAEWVRWCLTSKSSFPEEYRQDVSVLLETELSELEFEPEEIAYREHRALYSAHLWRMSKWESLSRFCRTPSDILRMLVHLTGGDVSLAAPVKFPPLKKEQRRRVLWLLDLMGAGPVVEEQLVNYRGLWLALERSLHSGSWKKLFPNAHRLLRRLQKGELRPRFSDLERGFSNLDKEAVLEELLTLPGGVSLRRFCQAVSLGGESMLRKLLPQVEKAQLKDQLVLLQVLSRDATATEALILTKRGSSQIIDRDPSRMEPALRATAVDELQRIVDKTIESRFGKDSWKGSKVFVDPSLALWTVPLGLRSASESLTVMGRGTRVPLDGQGSTLRMFLYWKQRFFRTDLDLSVISFDEDLHCTGHVSWTNLEDGGMVHSGDLQSAPYGAAEFIDARLEAVKAEGHRYLAMLAYRYCGETFSNMETLCGWMMREKPDGRYKTFDIATVEQKLLLGGEARYALPVLFDLNEREAIWLDLRVYGTESGNAVENSWQDIERMVKLGLDMPNWKLTLHQLALLHTHLRGAEQTEHRESADIVFSSDSAADYGPADWTKVLSQLL